MQGKNIRRMASTNPTKAAVCNSETPPKIKVFYEAILSNSALHSDELDDAIDLRYPESKSKLLHRSGDNLEPPDTVRVKDKFTYYLRNGLSINLIVCIDMTASNFLGTNKNLHQISKSSLNLYQQAIASICSILYNYDKDQ